jgi:UbiD family decarboxylase
MAYDDLRSFLDTLDKEGQLLRITDEVMPEPDIAAAANAAPRLGDAATTSPASPTRRSP